MFSLFELLSGIFLPAVGAIGGYMLSEYESRARPFIQVTHITGSRKEPNDREHVDRSIIEKLSGLFWLRALYEDSSIAEIDDVFLERIPSTKIGL